LCLHAHSKGVIWSFHSLQVALVQIRWILRTNGVNFS